MDNRKEIESAYIEIEGKVLATDQLDMLCQVAGKEFWITGGVIFNINASRQGFTAGTIVVPRWLARHNHLL